MKKIQFKKIAAYNFFCFGKEGIVLNFDKYDNVVLVNGKNLDTTPEGSDEHASNGAGKSTIPEIIVYGFYGKTIKKPKKLKNKNIINNKSGKGLRVEIEWDKYRLVRTRKPDGIQLWESEEGIWDKDTELSLGGIPATQKKIEELLGLSYESFVNIIVFTDNNSVSFLEEDAEGKRSIVENLLSLEKFRNYQDQGKKLLKSLKEEIQLVQIEQNHAENSIETSNVLIEKYKKDIISYKKTIAEKYISILSQISLSKKEIEKLESNNEELDLYRAEQDKLPKIDVDIAEIEPAKAKIKINIDKTNEAINSIKSEIEKAEELVSKEKEVRNAFEVSLKTLLSSMDKINKLEDGVECKHCMSIISKDNYKSILEKHKKEAEQIKVSWEESKAKLLELENNKNQVAAKKTSIVQVLGIQEEKISSLTKKLNNLLQEKSKIVSMKKPDSELKIEGLKQKIKILEEEAEKNNPDNIANSPFDKYLSDAEKELAVQQEKNDVLNKRIEEKRKEIPYYEYWISAFGDDGIRKYIIDGIIPALNENLAFWLSILIDNNLRIKFDNQFEEYIDKLPETAELSYFGISGGQTRRINLALSQAFAHITSLNSGCYFNLVFLDEVTSNIDKLGAEAIYRMILQLSQEKQVFVTTHDRNLLEYLKGCQTLNLVLKDGESKLEN